MKKITTIATLYLFYIAQITTAFAEDIEIYQGGDAGIRPNVTFLLDTSSEMAKKVTIEGSFYDHTQVYPGPFRNDRLYYYELPESESNIGDNLLSRNDILDNEVHPDAFKCETLRSTLEVKGYAASKFLQWDPSIPFEVYYAFKGYKPFHGVWRPLQNTLDPNRYIDCLPDIDNAHGLTAGDGKPYMTHEKNGEPYSSDYSDRIRTTLPAHIFKPASPAFAGRGWWGILPRHAVAATESIYTGNYLNYDFATQSGITQVPRLYFMGQIISDMVAQYPGLNVSLARFDGRYIGDFSISWGSGSWLPSVKYARAEGGMIPIEMMPSEGNALHFENTIKSWDAWGHTTIEESYYETSLYLRGQQLKYGDTTKTFDIRGLLPKYTTLLSAANTRQGGLMSSNIYQSPVEKSCQPNHIIVFASGSPEDDNDANNDIQNLISGTSLPATLSKTCSGHGDCANELAYYLSHEDLFDDATTGLKGTQTIRTHAITGFVDDPAADNFLKSISADHGQGEFKKGLNPKEIRDAFRSIFDTISGGSSSFTAPAVSVNAFNSLELGKELYYSVFEPSGNLSWKGNVKQYEIGEHKGKIEVLDADGKLAVDKTTGYFADGTRSFWTLKSEYADGDGKHVTSGGMASRLPETPLAFTAPSSNTDGTAKALVRLTSGSASPDELNIASSGIDQAKLLAWASGKNRKAFEDPLHSEPTLLTYSKDNTDKSIDRTLFVGTNSGFLHAFNVDSEQPTEHFRFIPKELLQNLALYYTGGGIGASKAYGIDGPISHWHRDFNGDGQVNNGEKAYVYIALRRGGQSIYALDVSDRTSPKLLWDKHGNYPADFPNKPDLSAGYENLGQTWGRLEPATIDWQGQKKVVLFTPGGYDPAEDGSLINGDAHSGPNNRITHTQGTTIYMIDALTGDVLWDAKADSDPKIGSQMNSSFPANVAPLDTNGDGLANLVYAADVGGKIWRFDFSSNEPIFKDGVTGSLIADTHGGAGNNNRRIYNEIDVIGNQGSNSIYLSVGTGNRSHPKMKNVSNYHYIIKDELHKSPTATAGVIVHSDLAQWPTDSDYGWYVPLSLGEKVLARSSTVSQQVLFTTFTPKDPVIGSCDVNPGTGKVYKLNLFKKTLKRAGLSSGGIPPSPVLIPPQREKQVATPDCASQGTCPTPTEEKGYSVLVGTEIVSFDDTIGGAYDTILKDYWLERH